jgi:hypothetical protein
MDKEISLKMFTMGRGSPHEFSFIFVAQKPKFYSKDVHRDKEMKEGNK